MFSALPTVEHEQVLRTFIRNETLLQYLREQATSGLNMEEGIRLAVGYADFYLFPSSSPSGRVTGVPTQSGLLPRYYPSDTCARVSQSALGALGVGEAPAPPRCHATCRDLPITEADLCELEASLVRTTGRILALLEVVRVVLFGKGLLALSTGSPAGEPRRSFDNATEGPQQGAALPSPRLGFSEAKGLIRRRLFPGILPVPVAVGCDGSEGAIYAAADEADAASKSEADARPTQAIGAAFRVAEDEFQCTSGGGIRSSAARSYLVRSVGYIQRLRDGTIQREVAGGGGASNGFLLEVARSCQECVLELEELDRSFMFSSARDEFFECAVEEGPPMGGGETENVLVICAEEIKTAFAFFTDAAHSLYSWAMNCIEMVDAYEQQGLLPTLPTAVPADQSSEKTTTSHAATFDRGGMPLYDASGSYLPLEDRAQTLYEYPHSSVSNQPLPLHTLMEDVLETIRQPNRKLADAPLTYRLDSSSTSFISGQRVLAVPYFSSIRQLILLVERETEMQNRNASSNVDVRHSPPPSRFRFLLDTLRLYYITSVTADERKTLEHFTGVGLALLSELATERSLMESNRNVILTSLQIRWESRRQEGIPEGDSFNNSDPLLPLYTEEEKELLAVSFGAFFRTRTALRGLISALQRDIVRRNRTHGVVMVTAEPTAKKGFFSSSVVPLVVRHYRAQKGKEEPSKCEQPSRGAAFTSAVGDDSTTVRTATTLESDENYLQGEESSSSVLFSSPREFYESQKAFFLRQRARLPVLKVPLAPSTLAQWRRLVSNAPVMMRHKVEAGCGSGRHVDAEEFVSSKRPSSRNSRYPVYMVPVRTPPFSSSPERGNPVRQGNGDGARDPNSSSTPHSKAGWISLIKGAWCKVTCSLPDTSAEVQDARRSNSSEEVFKGPPQSVVSPLVYRKEALLVALIDADNEAERMHEVLLAEYPTLYGSGSCASGERTKAGSTKFAAAFMPPAAAAAMAKEDEPSALVDGIMGATDRAIAIINDRTRSLLDLIEARRLAPVNEGAAAAGESKEAVARSPLVDQVTRVAQQFSVVFNPPK